MTNLFRGLAGDAPQPLRRFTYDEEGEEVEWAAPHLASEECAFGPVCRDMDYRARRTIVDGGALVAFEEPYPNDPNGPGKDRPFYHSLNRQMSDWGWFVECEIFVAEVPAHGETIKWPGDPRPGAKCWCCGVDAEYYAYYNDRDWCMSCKFANPDCPGPCNHSTPED